MATIRLADRADAGRLNTGLAHLSAALGDTHRATDDRIAAQGWGDWPAFRAQLAEEGDALVGLALYSPIYSTVRGGAGVYVSDLWVAAQCRSDGLGRRLLRAALLDAEAEWGAGFLRLQVYDHTPRARRFYDRLGFVQTRGLADLVLDTAACEALKGET